MTLRLNGSTSGYVEIDAPATAGSNNITLPSGNGSANQFLKNGSTAGTLGWSSMVEDSSGRLLVGTSSALTGSNSQYSKLVSLGNSLNTGGSYVAFGLGQVGTSLGAGVDVATINFTDNAAGQFASIACFTDAACGAGDYPGRLVFSTTADGASSPTERMRINNNGEFFFRTTNSDPAFNRTNGLHITAHSNILCRTNGAGWDLGASTSTPAHIYFYTDNGSARVAAGNISSNGSTTTYSATSDYRLKENIAPLAGATERVLNLRPVTFDWKEGLGGTQPQGEGFIAHEVQAVCPIAVTGEKDAVDEKGNPKYQGVDPAKLVALLTAALQEAIGEIESLKARVAALEGQ